MAAKMTERQQLAIALRESMTGSATTVQMQTPGGSVAAAPSPASQKESSTPGDEVRFEKEKEKEKEKKEKKLGDAASSPTHTPPSRCGVSVIEEKMRFSSVTRTLYTRAHHARVGGGRERHVHRRMHPPTPTYTVSPGRHFFFFFSPSPNTAEKDRQKSASFFFLL